MRRHEYPYRPIQYQRTERLLFDAVILSQPFDEGWMLLPFVLLYGAGTLLLGINVAHDAVHDALTTSKTLNNWLYLVSFTLIGIDGNLWKLRHNKAHHIIPNVEGADSAVTRNPLIRLSPHQPAHASDHHYHNLAELI